MADLTFASQRAEKGPYISKAFLPPWQQHPATREAEVFDSPVLLSTPEMPPSDFKPQLKPILRHRPRPKCVRFLANTINLETGSMAPVITRTARPSPQATIKTKDTKSSTEKNVVETIGTSSESSRSRSRSPYQRASSPYPGKISSASTQTLQEYFKKPGSRPVAQATTSKARVRNQSPSPTKRVPELRNAALPHQPRGRSTSRARSTSPRPNRIRPTVALPPSLMPKRSASRHLATTTTDTRSPSRAPRSRSRSRPEIPAPTPAPLRLRHSSPDRNYTRGRSRADGLVPTPAPFPNSTPRQRRTTPRSRSRPRAHTPEPGVHKRGRDIVYRIIDAAIGKRR